MLGEIVHAVKVGISVACSVLSTKEALYKREKHDAWQVSRCHTGNGGRPSSRICVSDTRGGATKFMSKRHSERRGTSHAKNGPRSARSLFFLFLLSRSRGGWATFRYFQTKHLQGNQINIITVHIHKMCSIGHLDSNSIHIFRPGNGPKKAQRLLFQKGRLNSCL